MNKYEYSIQDPQQTLLLEVVWECLENAGQAEWRGKDIGRFVGSFGEEWLDLSSKDTQKMNPYQAACTGDFELGNYKHRTSQRTNRHSGSLKNSHQ